MIRNIIAAVSATRDGRHTCRDYQGQSQNFSALPTDNAGQTIQGVKFSWSRQLGRNDNLARQIRCGGCPAAGLARQARADRASAVYDRWGNRTGVWDAARGGNQIQSVSLVQSGGVPTNRISSVTTIGTVNYSYDASGNMTNDGSHSYRYDSENRLVNLDSGAVTYAYDHQNRRYKKTVGSTVTHYIWEGAQVLAEHNGSAGATLVDYIQSGSRLLAKIASGTTNYFLSDRLSVRVMMNASGPVVGRQSHLPYGEDFAESGTQQKQHFTSYERDSESGSDYAVMD